MVVNNFSKLLLSFLAPILISSCSSVPSKVIALKDVYDGQEYTHAFRWRDARVSSQECAVLYRDKRLDTEKDDWMPFYQGLALKIGEEELNFRRKEKSPEYDNELFERNEQFAYCKEIDSIGFELDSKLDHSQVAIPEETRKRLDQLIKDIQKKDPAKSLDYINKLKIRYDPTLF